MGQEQGRRGQRRREQGWPARLRRGGRWLIGWEDLQRELRSPYAPVTTPYLGWVLSVCSSVALVHSVLHLPPREVGDYLILLAGLGLGVSAVHVWRGYAKLVRRARDGSQEDEG